MANDARTRLRPRDVGFKRLQFMTDFLSAAHIEYNDIAAFLGISRVAVSHWFAVDDMKLSQVFDIIEHYGFTLRLTMSGNVDSAVDRTVDVEPEDVEILQDGRYRLRRMSFLSFALRECGVTKKDLAARMGINTTSLRWMYSSDSMMVSRLFQAAEALDCSVRFDIDPKECTLSSCDGKARHYAIRITTFKDISI